MGAWKLSLELERTVRGGKSYGLKEGSSVQSGELKPAKDDWMRMSI
jgi:hypothetical protein